MNDWLNPEPDEDQLSLLPEPVEQLDPEPPPPAGPIRTLQQQVEDAGWITNESVACLYVSAGTDTRPFTYLRPGVIPGDVVAEESLPRFFVFVDMAEPGREEVALSFEDDRSRIETIDHHALGRGPWEFASLLRVRIGSDLYPNREYAVLRIRGGNEEITQEALAEGWAPDWFIGVRDGCGGCFNIIDSPEQSIPVRLGVSFWLTNDLRGYGLIDENFNRLHEFGHSIPVAGGQRLLEIATWRTWPSSGWGIDRWVSLFQLEDARKTSRPNQASWRDQPKSGSANASLSPRP